MHAGYHGQNCLTERAGGPKYHFEDVLLQRFHCAYAQLHPCSIFRKASLIGIKHLGRAYLLGSPKPSFTEA